MTKLLLGLAAAACLAMDVKGPMPAEDGETCVVCYGSCTREDVAYLVDGQRFAIMKPLEEEFLKNPEQYIRAYRPNSMQFQGGPAQGMNDGYLLFGLLALVGLIIAGFTAHRLIEKRHDPAAIPAGLAKIPTTKQPMPCPACGGENHPSAKACSHCGAEL